MLLARIVGTVVGPACPKNSTVTTGPTQDGTPSAEASAAVVDRRAVTSCPLGPFREHFRDLRGALHDARRPTAELCRMVWIYFPLDASSMKVFITEKTSLRWPNKSATSSACWSFRRIIRSSFQKTSSGPSGPALFERRRASPRGARASAHSFALALQSRPHSGSQAPPRFMLACASREGIVFRFHAFLKLSLLAGRFPASAPTSSRPLSRTE